MAALMVVFAHYLGAFYPFTLFGNAPDYIQHTLLECSVFYPPFGTLVAAHMAVCLFFIISGYVLTFKFLGDRLPVGEVMLLCLKRPIRLGGLVWVSLAVGGLFWACGLYQQEALERIAGSNPWALGFWNGPFDLFQFIKDFFFAPFSHGDRYNAVLWTIKYELYGSFQLFAFLLFFSGWKYRLIPATILLYLSMHSLYQGFWIGLIFADLEKFYFPRVCVSRRVKVPLFGLLWCTFFYIGGYPNYVTAEFLKETAYGWLPSDQGFQGGYPMLSAVLLFFLVFRSSFCRKILTSRPLLHLGWLSYGVYISHFIVIFTFSSGLFIILEHSLGYSIAFLTSVFSGCCVIYICSFLMIQYVDRPIVQLCQKYTVKIRQECSVRCDNYKSRIAKHN